MRTPNFLTVCLLAGLGSTASAAVLYTFDAGLPDAGQIPDANPVGWSDTRTLTGLPTSGILDVNVILALTGGFNGDLYGYLVHDTGFSVLLNRVGRTGLDPVGYGEAGLQVTFDDEATGPADIHQYQEVAGFSLTGGTAWRPDARDVGPATVVDTDTRSSFLDSFLGSDPNGDWTLFLADLSGGEVSQVTSWGLVIAVPEPSQTGVWLAVMLGAGVVLRRRLGPGVTR